MTIYHIGTEDVHFVRAGGAAIDTSTGKFRGGWARCALQASSGQFWRGPLQAHPVSTTEAWLTFQMYEASTVLAQGYYCRFVAGTYWRLRLWGKQGEFPKLQYRDNAGVITDLATGFLPLAPWFIIQRQDIYFNLGTGQFQVYLDRELALDYTGNLTGSGEISAINWYDLTGGDFQGNYWFSEVCWRSDSTRKMLGVQSIWPYDDGVNMDWVGAKEDVDEVVVDETDANHTDTPGLVQEYKIPPLVPGLTGNIVIGAIMVGARMATGPTDEALVVRTAGTDYLGASQDTGGAIEDRMSIWEVNPDTGLPWTPAEVGDAAFNMGVASV